MIQDLWWRCNLPADCSHRDGLPPILDRKWFCDRFCGGKDLSEITEMDEIWSEIECFFLYDQLSVMLAIPEVSQEHFAPVHIQLSNGGNVYVVGVRDEANQVINGPATADWLIKRMLEPLKRRTKRA